MFSIVAAPVYIPTSNAQVFHILVNTYYFWLFDTSHSNRNEVISHCGIFGFVCLFLVFFGGVVYFLFRAAPTAYGGSQASGLMGAVAAGLCHSHSNAGSEPHLQPYTTAHGNAGSLTH